MNKWDEKAKNYSRYTEGNDRFEAKILQALNALHVELKNKNMIDIGCGTGVYTLRVAQIAHHVDALDSSKEMLEVLKEDAHMLNLENITTFHASWDEFSLPKSTYDVAICTMSPAVSTSENFHKMTTCAKTKVYLGWAGKRYSAILEEMVLAHHSIYTQPNGAEILTSWLDNKNISYTCLPFDEQRETKKEFDKALESFIWHLEIKGIKPDAQKVKKILELHCDKDGFVTEKLENMMNLIVW